MKRGKDDIDVIEYQRLKELINLYFHGSLWVLGWCRQEEAGVSIDERTGLSVHGEELDCLLVDREELLSLLIAGELDSIWVRATRSYQYVTLDGKISSAAPVVPVDATRVERLDLKPDPALLPDSYLMNVLKDTCCSLELDYRQFTFHYHGSLGDDALRLVRLFCNLECEREALVHDLHEWHIRVMERLKSWGHDNFYSPASDNTQHGEAVLSPASNLQMTRQQMASFLHCSVRTLIRREICGCTPEGWFWPRAIKGVGNAHYYEVAECWDTLKKIMPRGRDREKDLQLREEILAGTH